ncbi:hypothetical protein GEMRC1_006952 [Eukaryota sp. GEM-RC1]
MVQKVSSISISFHASVNRMPTPSSPSVPPSPTVKPLELTPKPSTAPAVSFTSPVSARPMYTSTLTLTKTLKMTPSPMPPHSSSSQCYYPYPSPSRCKSTPVSPKKQSDIMERSMRTSHLRFSKAPDCPSLEASIQPRSASARALRCSTPSSFHSPLPEERNNCYDYDDYIDTPTSIAKVSSLPKSWWKLYWTRTSRRLKKDAFIRTNDVWNDSLPFSENDWQDDSSSITSDPPASSDSINDVTATPSGKGQFVCTLNKSDLPFNEDSWLGLDSAIVLSDKGGCTKSQPQTKPPYKRSSRNRFVWK